MAAKSLVVLFFCSFLAFFVFWFLSKVLLNPKKKQKRSRDRQPESPGANESRPSLDFDVKPLKAEPPASSDTEELKSQIRVSADPEGKPVSFKVMSGARMLEMAVHLKANNISVYSVSIEKIEWEIWVSGIYIKSGVYTSRINLSPGAINREIRFCEILGENQLKDVLWLKKDARAYVRTKMFCSSELGAFEKSATLLDLEVSLAEETKQEIKRYTEQSKPDPLTGALQRQFLDVQLQPLIDTSNPAFPLAFMMIDIDHFKKINDQLGHLAGDEVLIKVASVIRSEVPPDGYLVRYGGDEFAVIVPGCDSERAREIAEKMRSTIERMDYAAQLGNLKPTISTGIAIVTEKVHYKSLIRNADDMLRFSKQQGKNRIGINVRRISDPSG